MWFIIAVKCYKEELMVKVMQLMKKVNGGDAAFPSTYNGQWLNGLPNGSGEFKQYSPNHFPPNGKTQDHYIGTFKDGMMDGKGKQYLYRVEDSKTKWRKVFYKKGKLIKYF